MKTLSTFSIVLILGLSQAYAQTAPAKNNSKKKNTKQAVTSKKPSGAKAQTSPSVPGSPQAAAQSNRGNTQTSSPSAAVQPGRPIRPPVSLSGPLTAARETSIDRIVIPVFKAKTNDSTLAQLWNAKKLEYQKDFVSLLNERSYLDAFAAQSEKGLDDAVSAEAVAAQADGVLAGEFQGHSIELALKSGASGRTLVRLTVPVTDLNKQTVRDISAQAVDAIVTSFPYRGFVSQTLGDEARLTIGRAQGLSVGTRLEIAEFDGSQPNFSSPMSKVGELVVTKIGPNEAIGKVTRSTRPVTPYMKVAFPKAGASTADQLERRAHTGFWLAPSIEFTYIDTQTSDTTPNLRTRTYQVPLSPMLALAGGYSNWNFHAVYNNLSNSSNTVTMIRGDLMYQLFTTLKTHSSWMTSIGGYYSSYNATPLNGAVLPLVSTSTVAPKIEERWQVLISPHTRLFLAGEVYFPVFETDQANGASSATASFGAGGLGGIRLDLSNSLAVEGGVHSDYFRMMLQTGDGVAEFEYDIFGRLLILF